MGVRECVKLHFSGGSVLSRSNAYRRGQGARVDVKILGFWFLGLLGLRCLAHSWPLFVSFPFTSSEKAQEKVPIFEDIFRWPSFSGTGSFF